MNFKTSGLLMALGFVVGAAVVGVVWSGREGRLAAERRQWEAARDSTLASVADSMAKVDSLKRLAEAARDSGAVERDIERLRAKRKVDSILAASGAMLAELVARDSGAAYGETLWRAMAKAAQDARKAAQTASEALGEAEADYHACLFREDVLTRALATAQGAVVSLRHQLAGVKQDRGSMFSMKPTLSIGPQWTFLPTKGTTKGTGIGVQLTLLTFRLPVGGQ